MINTFLTHNLFLLLIFFSFHPPSSLLSVAPTFLLTYKSKTTNEAGDFVHHESNELALSTTSVEGGCVKNAALMTSRAASTSVSGTSPYNAPGGGGGKISVAQTGAHAFEGLNATAATGAAAPTVPSGSGAEKGPVEGPDGR